MNSINGIIIAVFILLYSPIANISTVPVADKMTPGDMIKSSFMKTYKPINHEESVTFALWKQKIKDNLVKKPIRKTSKK